MEIYEAFISDGSMSLNSDFTQSTPIKILRDTGASQSLILADTLAFSEKTSSVMYRSITFICSQTHTHLLFFILDTGLVAVGIRLYLLKVFTVIRQRFGWR